MRQHRFGGSWTVKKLDALRAYLGGYAVLNLKFRTIFSDSILRLLTTGDQ